MLGKNLEQILDEQVEMMKISNKRNYKKVLVYGDVHYPYHDEKALNILYSYMHKYKPDIVVLNGDLNDYYAISVFDKNPDHFDLQYELDLANQHLLKVRKIIGKKAKFYYLLGNHELRVKKYVYKNAELIGLKAFQLDNLYDLKENNIKMIEGDIDYWRKDNGWLQLGNVVIMHGDNRINGASTSKYSGYSVKNTILGATQMNTIIGHCFDEETEILTKDGWKKGLELDGIEFVATVNKNMGFEWNEIEYLVRAPKGTPMIKIDNMTHDLWVTDEHILIVEDKNTEEIKKIYAKELLNQKDRFNMFNAALPNKKNKGVSISDDLLRVFVNFLADGNMTGNYITWHLKKKRKIVRLKELFNKLGWDYKERESYEGRKKIVLYAEHGKNLVSLLDNPKEKKVPKWFMELNRHQAEIVLDEYSKTDGCKNSSAKNSYQISSSKEEEIDILQAMFVMNGFRTTKIKRKNQGNRKDSWILTVNTRIKSRISKKSKVRYEGVSDQAWCVIVPNHTVIVRRNGKVSITGNCHRLAKFYHTTPTETYIGMEGGSLCRKTGTANWQQGFVTFELYKNKMINPKLHHINSGTMYEDEMVYKG